MPERTTFEKKLLKWKGENPIRRGTLVEYWMRGDTTSKVGFVRDCRCVDGHMQYFVKGKWRGHCCQVPTRNQIEERKAELYPGGRL